MRKIVLSIAVAGAALIAASPAAAQYYPQPQPYGYGAQPYGYGQQNGYGFQGNWGQFRALQARLNNVERPTCSSLATRSLLPSKRCK